MIDLREILMRADAVKRQRNIYVQNMILRCGRKVQSELLAQGRAMSPMPVVVDKWIEPGAWRITDRDHTLLWDSRMQEDGR